MSNKAMSAIARKVPLTIDELTELGVLVKTLLKSMVND